MKALVLHGVGNIKYEPNWPDPKPKNGWAVIKVLYCGICGSDLPRMMVAGAYHHPLICGHEFVGQIHETAGQKYKKGDKVAVIPLIPCKNCEACREGNYFHCVSYNFVGSRTDGAFAEYCLVPEENLFKLPEGTEDRAGAFIEPISVALHVIRRTGFKEGSTAIIFGAGSIGLLIGYWLRLFGASKIVFVTRSEFSVQNAKKQGFIVYGNKDPAVESLPSFDYCFEAAGSNAALIQALKKVKNKGTIGIVGRDTKDICLPLDVYEKQLMRKEVDVKGCWGYVFEEKTVLDFLKKSKIDFSGLVTQEAELSEGEKIISRMFNKEMQYCKVLFKI